MTAYVSPVVTATTGPGYVLDLHAGDYIKSPSGVYYATLLPNSAQFVVSQGTDPTTSGLNTVWSTPDGSGAAMGGQPIFMEFADGSGGIFTRNAQAQIYAIGFQPPGFLPTTISLADNGAFTLSTGTPTHPGQQTFSNNVNDPVVAYDLTGITYDLAHPTITSTTPVTGVTYDAKNETSQTQVFPASLTLKYTKSSNWSFSVSDAITLGVKTSFDVGIPGIGETKSEISLSETATIGRVEGGSDSEEKDFMAGVNITVPPDSFYQAVLTGTREMFNIPFTYKGVAQYQDGAMVPVDGSGMFAGADTGIFETVITCVDTPGGCNTPPLVESALPPGGGGTPVPEPGSLSLMSGAVLVLAALRRRLVRRARAPGRRPPPCTA